MCAIRLCSSIPAAAITAEAAAAGLTGSQRAGADTCVRYLTSKQELLRYDQALEAGWPIATGIIEGACRHIIADPLDIGGAGWGLDGAESVHTLRAAGGRMRRTVRCEQTIHYGR